MALTPLQVQNFCFTTQGNCKYLETEFRDNEFYYCCIKKSPSLIEKKKKQFLQAVFRWMMPWDQLPDNCPGYRYLKYVKQGYDVPGST